MAKLKYTDEELIKLYRGAADKNKQIEILADMRCCKPEEVIQMLADAGEIPGMKGKVKSKSEEGRKVTDALHPTPHPSPVVTPSPQGEGLNEPRLAESEAVEEQSDSNVTIAVFKDMTKVQDVEVYSVSDEVVQSRMLKHRCEDADMILSVVGDYIRILGMGLHDVCENFDETQDALIKTMSGLLSDARLVLKEVYDD